MSESLNDYVHLATIGGLTGAILCLSLSEDGKLAAGGDDGTKLWKVPEIRSIPGPSASGIRGATTALTWIKREDEPEDILVYGSQSGILVGWKEARLQENESHFEEILCVELAMPSEITGICFDPTTNRLAVSNRNSVVQLFAVHSQMSLSSIFSVVIDNHVPKAIAFERVNHSKAILSFGLYDGKIHTLGGDTGKIEKTIETGGMIGNAQLDVQRNILCIDDPGQGAALYKADSRVRVRSYAVPVKKAMRPRQVSFAEDCSKIVVGSDHGKVYIFDRRKGSIMQELLTGDHRMWVQTVTAVEVVGIPFIIAAKSQDDGRDGEIFLWRRAAKVHLMHKERKVGHWRAWLLQLVLVITSIAFICQNLGVRNSFIASPNGKILLA